MITEHVIKCMEDFIGRIRNDSAAWDPREPKWFRGEPESKTALVPTLYRSGLGSKENPLLQTFRTRASGYHDLVPIREHTDQWLFLARHAGLQTRLLDWSESALIALHFALKEEQAVIWMLNPLELNELSYTSPTPREFPLVWHNPREGRFSKAPANPAFENLRGAWENDQPGAELPIAIHPTYVHPRLRSQGSCFTIHGKRKGGLDTLLPSEKASSILLRYVVDSASRQSIISDLALLGITESVVFPDLDGLATELNERFS